MRINKKNTLYALSALLPIQIFHKCMKIRSLMVTSFFFFFALFVNQRGFLCASM